MHHIKLRKLKLFKRSVPLWAVLLICWFRAILSLQQYCAVNPKRGRSVLTFFLAKNMLKNAKENTATHQLHKITIVQKK